MKTWNVVLKCGLILTTVASLPLPGQEANRSVSKKQVPSSSAPGRVWKSETTGKEYRVRIEKDRVSAEWVNIPPESARHGAYIRSELHRVGSKWVGTSRSLLPCALGQGASEHIGNWCQLVTRFEIDAVTDDRITGRGESLRRFDCQGCKILETAWGNFVWVPKEKTVRRAKSASVTGSHKK